MAELQEAMASMEPADQAQVDQVGYLCQNTRGSGNGCLCTQGICLGNNIVAALEHCRWRTLMHPLILHSISEE